MKKRILSLVLAVCLLAVCVPLSAGAAAVAGFPLPSGKYQVSALAYYSSGSQHTNYLYTWGPVKNKTYDPYCHADIVAAANTPIYAVADGKVITNTYGSGGGNYLVIRHNDGTYSYYGHMIARSSYAVGSTVKAKTEIGKVGMSGSASGYHLHFEWSGHDPYCEYKALGYISGTQLAASKYPHNHGTSSSGTSGSGTSVTVKAETYAVASSELTATSAILRGYVSASNGKVTECGCYFGTSANNLKFLGSDSINTTGTKCNYKTEKYYGKLTPRTTYYFRIYAKSGSTTVWGNILSFKTPACSHQKGAFQFFEDAHPHYNYYKCSVCGQNFTDGTTHGKYEKCTTCYPPTVSAPAVKSVTVSGTSVTVNWSGVTNATSYDAYLLQAPWGWEDIKYSKSLAANVTSCTFTDVKPGGYVAFVVARPNANSVQSNWYNFSVQEKPKDPSISFDKTNYVLGDTVVITPSATNATSYALSIWDGGAFNQGQRVFGKGDFTGSVSYKPEKAGLYNVRIDAINSSGVVSLDKTFTVTEPDPEPEEDTPAVDAPAIHFPAVNFYTQGQFTDVPANQWYTNNVGSVFETGLMVGSGAGTFSPFADVTVAEAVAMAARVHSIYTTGSENFTRTGNTWYQTYLDYAYQNGIITAKYYNGDVTKKATRAQFAEIFAASMPGAGLTAVNTIADNAIPDVKTSNAYAGSVYKLYRAGILAGGDAKGTFSPETFITRAEAAAIVSRLGDTDLRVHFTLK